MNADLTLIAMFSAMEMYHSRFNERFGHVYRTIQAFHRNTRIAMQDPDHHAETVFCIPQW